MKRVEHRVPTAQGKQGKQGKWLKEIPVRENTGNLEILPKHRENTGNLVCSSCKFPDSKGIRYCKICRENLPIFFSSLISLPSQFCVCKNQKPRKLSQGKFAVGQGKNRENTGNLKMQFEWVPCQQHFGGSEPTAGSELPMAEAGI